MVSFHEDDPRVEKPERVRLYFRAMACCFIQHQDRGVLALIEGATRCLDMPKARFCSNILQHSFRISSEYKRGREGAHKVESNASQKTDLSCLV